MLDKIKEIAKDFGYGLIVTAGIVSLMLGMVYLLEFLEFVKTKEQGSTVILGMCMLFLVYTFGGLLRFNRK